MRDTILLALAVYLPVWWLAQPLGNHGLWLAFTAFTLVRSASLASVYLHYRRTRWTSAATPACDQGIQDQG